MGEGRAAKTRPTIFLTGFPGFLGSALAGRLLDRHTPDVTVTALVQPKYRRQAEARVREIESENDARRGRIVLIEGDITHPKMGMNEGTSAGLLERALEVYHLAAVYDLGVARDLAMRVNVEGTKQVLAFARNVASLRRLHYVSTCYVSGRTLGAFRETDLKLDQTFNNHYEETKYLAEVEVQRSMREGLPTTIYRPTIVVGDSRTGATQKYDGPYALIRWMLRWPGAVPMPVVGDPRQTVVNLVPRDFVVDAMNALSAIDASRGRVYHLADPRPLTVDQLIQVLAEAAARRPLRIPIPERIASGALRRVPGICAWSGIQPETLAYFTHPTRYDTTQATRDLESSGVACPPFESYANKLVAFVRANPNVAKEGMV